jgi:hypothetical protein
VKWVKHVKGIEEAITASWGLVGKPEAKNPLSRTI